MMLSHVREDDADTVLTHEISRLARHTADLLALVKQLTGKGVNITFKKKGLTFTGDKTNAMNQVLLTMLGAVSSFELVMINERRAEGQARARAEGKHMGRSAKLSADQVATIRQRAATGSKTALAKEYGVRRATLYAAIKTAWKDTGCGSGHLTQPQPKCWAYCCALGHCRYQTSGKHFPSRGYMAPSTAIRNNKGSHTKACNPLFLLLNPGAAAGTALQS